MTTNDTLAAGIFLLRNCFNLLLVASLLPSAVGCATHHSIKPPESQAVSANSSGSEALKPENTQPYTVPAGWQLVWNDEFDGTTLDTNKWTAYVGNTTGGNVYYTRRPKNVYVANGLLHLVARHWGSHGYSYTSGQVRTEFKYSKKYGLIVARIRMPAGSGFWPAFWLLGTNYDPKAQWPHCGEIDIPESAGGSPTWVQGTIHNADVNGQDTYQTLKYYFPTPGDTVTNFHTYGILWTSNSITWQVDGLDAQTWTNWGAASGTNAFPVPFNQPFFFLLQLAVTRPGGYGGSPNARTPFPSEVQVDYVRVYDRPAATTPGSGANPGNHQPAQIPPPISATLPASAKP